jgi:hypothetical protein
MGAHATTVNRPHPVCVRGGFTVTERNSIISDRNAATDAKGTVSTGLVENCLAEMPCQPKLTKLCGLDTRDG